MMEFSQIGNTFLITLLMVIIPMLVGGLTVVLVSRTKNIKVGIAIVLSVISLFAVSAVPGTNFINGLAYDSQDRIKQMIADDGTTVSNEEFDMLFNNSTIFKDNKAISAHCDFAKCSLIIVPLAK